MISPEQKAHIRRLFHGEHWKLGTIAAELGLHPDTVRAALEVERFQRGPAPRAALTDPYLEFIGRTLLQHPRLRATRLYEMLRDRGYRGSVVQLRRVVAALRPPAQEAFLRLATLPGEHYGEFRVMVRSDGDSRVLKSISAASGLCALHNALTKTRAKR